MAYNTINSDGALFFNWITEVQHFNGCTTVFTATNEQFIVEHGVDISTGWHAFRCHKSETLIAVPGVIDLRPYIIDWATALDGSQTKDLKDILGGLKTKGESLMEWRNQLSEAEHAAILSGTFAVATGANTVVQGGLFVADLLSGGIPIWSGLFTAVSAAACHSSICQMEAAAKRGDRAVRAINTTMVELIDLGRAIDLPFCTPHYTPIVQSACTDLAKAFGWKDKVVRATQAGINSWLQSGLNFGNA